ncbi:CPBP family intramembrane glutamic endopeptidase [Micromonospora endophytica]|nr:CPBP family intramembrane glutamic endopeptidase [Micromonospora endophytica]
MTTLPQQPAPGVTPAPVPYHRLAHTGRHRWWRPALGTLLILAGLPLLLAGGVAAVGSIVVLAGGPRDFLDRSAEAELAFTLLPFAALLPLTLLAARWVQRRPAGTVSSVAGRLRGRWLATCLLLAVPVVGTSFGLLDMLPGDGTEFTWTGWPRVAAGLALVVLLVPLQVAGEEYFFRGWLVQAFGSWMRSPWPGVGLSSVVFGLVHGLDSGWSLVALIFYGVVSAVLTIRTGGLEAALGLHIVNNVSVIALIVVTGTMDANSVTTAPAAIVDMVAVMIYAEAALYLARRHGIKSGGAVRN